MRILRFRVDKQKISKSYGCDFSGISHCPFIINTGYSFPSRQNDAAFLHPSHSSEKEKEAFKYPDVPSTIPISKSILLEVIQKQRSWLKVQIFFILNSVPESTTTVLPEQAHIPREKNLDIPLVLMERDKVKMISGFIMPIQGKQSCHMVHKPQCLFFEQAKKLYRTSAGLQGKYSVPNPFHMITDGAQNFLGFVTL